MGASLDFGEETDSASGQNAGPGVEAHFEDACAQHVEGLPVVNSDEAEFEDKSDDQSLHVTMHFALEAVH